MSGGITALVATGAQDVHLVGDPEVSFFRSNYKRHTNFSQVRHRQIIQGNPAANGMSTVRFERKGDLLSYTYLVAKSSGATVADVGQFIDHIELYIGGQLIDRQSKEYSTAIWPNTEAPTTNKSDQTGLNNYHYPLHFFFCDDWTQALPLVGLQYHDVEIRIYWSSAVASQSFECWSNFIYLDDPERRWFAEKPMNMLIKQVQENNGSSSKAQDFTFNHPVAYIATETTDPTDSGTPESLQLTFKINGTDFGDPMEITPHYNTVPHYQYTNKSGTNHFLLSFSLNLSDLKQPSGSLNFSRIDSARLLVDPTSSATFNASKFYAVNYNILRIENGLGGLLYSN